MFRSYMHVERLGTDSVEGILDCHCVITTKLDGTSAVISLEDGKLQVGSRRRVITLGDDNAGCANYVYANKKFLDYLHKYPNHILYGEFLVKHHIKTYRADAWKKFYTFDVYDKVTERYIPYEEWINYVKEFGIEYIPAIAIIDKPTEDDIAKLVDKSVYLNNGNPGEGIVIHAVDFINKYGKTVFAKVVRSEYKQKPKNDLGTIEQQIVDKYCTDAFIQKEYCKLVEQEGSFTPDMTYMLISRIYHEFITEECWNFVKKYHNPTINFKKLQKLVTERIKKVVLSYI